MIFSAGLGTRFKPWTDNHPKALFPIHGKSLLERNILYLQQYGIYEVVVNVHHFADQMVEAIQNNNGWGSRITISDETDLLLETGGGLLHARALLEQEPFLTLNADFLTNLNLEKLIHFHETNQPVISIAVTDRPASRSLLFDTNNQLCGWRNNQSGETRIVHNHDTLIPKSYSCVAAYMPQVFELMTHRGKFSVIETFLEMAATHLVLGYDHSGDITVDVGKPESVAEAERLFQ